MTIDEKQKAPVKNGATSVVGALFGAAAAVPN